VAETALAAVDGLRGMTSTFTLGIDADDLQEHGLIVRFDHPA
jgi:hypothetical protein